MCKSVCVYCVTRNTVVLGKYYHAKWTKTFITDTYNESTDGADTSRCKRQLQIISVVYDGSIMIIDKVKI